jgi:hypothetical protein
MFELPTHPHPQKSFITYNQFSWLCNVLIILFTQHNKNNIEVLKAK